MGKPASAVKRLKPTTVRQPDSFASIAEMATITATSRKLEKEVKVHANNMLTDRNWSLLGFSAVTADTAAARDSRDSIPRYSGSMPCIASVTNSKRIDSKHITEELASSTHFGGAK
jgi:hypothetical protein